MHELVTNQLLIVHLINWLYLSRPTVTLSVLSYRELHFLKLHLTQFIFTREMLQADKQTICIYIHILYFVWNSRALFKAVQPSASPAASVFGGSAPWLFRFDLKVTA